MAAFEREAAKRARDVRVDADAKRQRVVEEVGVVDPDLGELGAQLEPAPRIPRIGFSKRDRHVEARPELEA